MRRTIRRAWRQARLARRRVGRLLLQSEIAVIDGANVYRFVCVTGAEEDRARTMLEKEPQTIAWLRESLRPDDVFYDVGANVGVFTIYAGARLGAAGLVYAFEPHTPNAQALLHNVVASGVAGRVRVLTVALAGADGFRDFNYRSLHRGASASQFGSTATPEGDSFRPVASELKCGCTVDSLVERGVLRPPTIVKIDVDGLEDEILRGMRGVLTARVPPRSVQVEVGPHTAPLVFDFMAGVGYLRQQRHWSPRNESRAMAAADPDSVFPCNVIFVPGGRNA